MTGPRRKEKGTAKAEAKKGNFPYLVDEPGERRVCEWRGRRVKEIPFLRRAWRGRRVSWARAVAAMKAGRECVGRLCDAEQPGSSARYRSRRAAVAAAAERSSRS